MPRRMSFLDDFCWDISGVIAMSKIRFQPWIGERYHEADLYGLRILLLGESHYGKGDEDSSFTERVVKKWGQDNRHGFFTTIAKFILNQGKGGNLSAAKRRAFWEKVAFYNYVQEIVGKKARQRPTLDMWKRSENAYYQVLQQLKPDLVVVLGKQLARNLPAPVDGLVLCKVTHPSGGFKYKDHVQSLVDAIEEAKRRKLLNAAIA